MNTINWNWRWDPGPIIVKWKNISQNNKVLSFYVARYFKRGHMRQSAWLSSAGILFFLLSCQFFCLSTNSTESLFLINRQNKTSISIFKVNRHLMEDFVLSPPPNNKVYRVLNYVRLHRKVNIVSVSWCYRISEHLIPNNYNIYNILWVGKRLSAKGTCWARLADTHLLSLIPILRTRAHKPTH